MLGIILVIVGIILLFLFCACIVSSRCSRMEENNEKESISFGR